MQFAVYLDPAVDPTEASAPDYLIPATPDLEAFLASFPGPAEATGKFLVPLRDLLELEIPADLRQRLAVMDEPAMVVLDRRD